MKLIRNSIIPLKSNIVQILLILAEQCLMLKFDLKMPVIQPEQSVYMLHPGKNYHLFERFQEFSCVATDLPNLKLGNGITPSNVKSLDAQISRARALRDWLALNQDDRKKVEVSTKLSDYDGLDYRRFHESFKETLIDLLWRLQEGTPIFVPYPGLDKRGFFCELESRSSDRIHFPGPRIAKDFSYLGRPVRNVQVVPMRLIPPEILEEKGRTSILTKLDPKSSERMLRLYYGSFSIIGQVSQTEIKLPAEIFRPADANIINGLANFLEENLQKFNRGDMEATKFVDAMFYAFDEGELQVHASLNSPGLLQIAAKTAAPALLAFFIAIPDALPAEQVAQELKNKSILIENSSCPQDNEYPTLVGETLFGILDMLGEDDILEVCKRVREFKERTGARVNSVVEEKTALSYQEAIKVK